MAGLPRMRPNCRYVISREEPSIAIAIARTM
jgi:hypothetical protein